MRVLCKLQHIAWYDCVTLDTSIKKTPLCLLGSNPLFACSFIVFFFSNSLFEEKKFLICLNWFWCILALNPSKAWIFGLSSFFSERERVNLTPYSYFKKNLSNINITLCNCKQPIQSRFKVRKCWHHLLYYDVISFFVTRICQKIWKMKWNEKWK